jgi:hypothetical protein
VSDHPPWGKKLTPDDVRAIRASSEKRYLLAHQYGISEVSVWEIRKGRTWKWVQ